MKMLGKSGVLILLLVCSLFTGCATLALSGITMGAGYTMMNASNRTSNYPLKHVYMATVLALSDMDIQVVDDKEVDDGQGRKIKARTRNLSIGISIESITTNTTKMSVNASKSVIILDKATADAIIEETHQILSNDMLYFEDNGGKAAPVRILHMTLRGLGPYFSPTS